jgi:nucleoside-diphosphate kinase
MPAAQAVLGKENQMQVQELEQTLVLIKPDALKNSLTGYVLSQLSEFHTGLRFAGAKIVQVGRMLAEEHYAEHRGKPFFPAIIEYIMGRAHYTDAPQRRRVIALVYQGQGAIKKIRDIAGPTNPHDAREQRPGSVRALGTIVPLKNPEGEPIGQRMDNLIHASANTADAEREIKLWFKPNDIPPAMRAFKSVQCKDHYYFKKDTLYTRHEPDSICLLAPGDAVWASDLEVLEKIIQGKPAAYTMQAVAAKYLINEERENE